MANKLRTKIREELIKGIDNKDLLDKRFQYYFSEFGHNLIKGMNEDHEKMFRDGSGNELEDKLIPAKARAIDSSSMLSYNFFRNIDGNHSIFINGIEYNKCLFEVKLPTLTTRGGSANIDVVLLSKDEIHVLFIESKFLEYLESDSTELADSYKKLDSFYADNKESEGLCKICKSYKVQNGHYNYGIKQNICHLVGISNLFNSDKAKEKFRQLNTNSLEKSDMDIITSRNISFSLIDVLFVPDDEEAIEKYNIYNKDITKFVDGVPEEIRGHYIPEPFVMNYREIYSLMHGFDTETMDWLYHRYIQFHQG